jgi:CDP-diacylglycerol--serine O-phosphatidyltransferase
MRKIYIVPNIVTTANMFAGFYSIIASIHSDFVGASWAILAAAVFDALDGRVARLAKATSQFGVEYDSLSDVLSFGMAPAILLYQWTLEPFGRLGWLAAFLYLACGALRLARFNVTADKLPKNYFLGLPIPGAAGLVATFMIFNQTVGWPTDSAEAFFTRERVALGLTFGLASLMVSNVKFPSFKEFNWRSRASFSYLLIGVLAMILISAKPEIALFLVLSAYVGGSLLWNLYRLFSKRPSLVNSPGKYEGRDYDNRGNRL